MASWPAGAGGGAFGKANGALDDGVKDADVVAILFLNGVVYVLGENGARIGHGEQNPGNCQVGVELFAAHGFDAGEDHEGATRGEVFGLDGDDDVGSGR